MFAHDLLETFYNKDDERAFLSLIRNIPTYDNATCMQVAVASRSLTFIAHPCFQNILVKIWYFTILPDVSYKRLAFSVLFPFLAPLLVSFQKKKMSSKQNFDTENPLEHLEMENDDNFDHINNEEDDERETNSHVYFQEHHYIQKLYFFIMTPFVKFVYHQVGTLILDFK